MEQSKKVILCVDDEAIILLSIKSFIINHFGGLYLCETAMNGKEALEIIDELTEENRELFLVITDWVMPVMNGEELIEELSIKYPEVHKIIVTGQMDNSTYHSFSDRDDIAAVLMKPWQSENLLDIIRNLP